MYIPSAKIRTNSVINFLLFWQMFMQMHSYEHLAVGIYKKNLCSYQFYTYILTNVHANAKISTDVYANASMHNLFTAFITDGCVKFC